MSRELVIPADDVVPRILAPTCLDRLIPCFASLEEALAQASAAANRRRDARWARYRPAPDPITIRQRLFAGWMGTLTNS